MPAHRPLRLALSLLAAAAAGDALAKAGGGDPSQMPQPVPIGPVFVYVYESGVTNPSGDPLQQLVEARLTTSGARAGYWVKTLGDNKGDGSPETFHAVVAAPANRLAISYSIQLPPGAIDHDLRVWDLSQHKLLLFFNEHSLQGKMHRSTCHSAQLDGLIASQAAMGVPAATLATYDYQIAIDGQDSANVPQIQLVEWINNNTVHLKWPQHIHMGPQGSFLTTADETFDLQVRVTGSNAPVVLACAAPAALTLPPRPIHALKPGGTGGAGTISIDGTALNFPTRLLKLGPLKRVNPRSADMAAGNIPKTGPYAAP
jgi:hypothetical protein